MASGDALVKAWKLSIEVEGPEGCIAGGQGHYLNGKTASLEAVPADGCTFLGWFKDGELVDAGASTTISIDRDISLRAVFDAVPDEERIVDGGMCGESLYWELRGDGSLRISGSGEMWSWAARGESPWHAHEIKISSISIDGAASIGGYAFCYLTGLSEVAVPGTVSNVGEFAFYRCTGVRELVLEEGVSQLGRSAFSRCDGLERLVAPDSLGSVGKNAFYGLTFLSPDGSKLAQTADSLRGGVFEGEGKVLTKVVPPAVGDEFVVDGLLYRIVSDSPLEASLMGYETAPQHLVVPSSVRAGGLDVPVTSIGSQAFYGCKALKTADLGGVSKVDVKAFVRCTGLSSVYAGDSLSTISAYAFFKCTSLSEFDLGGSLKTMKVIGSYAFQYDEKLSGIALPSFLSTVGGSAFSMPFVDEGRVALEATAESLRGYVYDNVGGTLVRQPGVEVGKELSWNGLTLIVTASLPAEAGISGYSGKPTSLVLPGQIEIEGDVYSITSVMTNAFKGCKTLVTADLAGVERLEAQAFYGCTKLSSVSAPDLVTVGTKAFCRCTSLKVLDLGDGLTTIGAYGFWGCTSLESVELPDSVGSIGTYAFQRCSSLSSIGLGESLTLIGSYAFDGTAIVSLEIPDSIVRLKENALSGCSGLREVVFEGGTKVILHAGVFEGTQGIERIAMPDGFRKIYAGALDGISFLDGDGNSIAATAKNLAGHTFVGEGGELVLSA